MKGYVDDKQRALIELHVGARPRDATQSLTAWIDTAFDGHLVFPRELVEELALEPLAETEAILADGTKVVLDAYLCYLNWFGAILPLQVIANEGRFPLLGTGLLADRVLQIDYVQSLLSLE